MHTKQNSAHRDGSSHTEPDFRFYLKFYRTSRSSVVPFVSVAKGVCKRYQNRPLSSQVRCQQNTFGYWVQSGMAKRQIFVPQIGCLALLKLQHPTSCQTASRSKQTAMEMVSTLTSMSNSAHFSLSICAGLRLCERFLAQFVTHSHLRPGIDSHPVTARVQAPIHRTSFHANFKRRPG